MALKKTIQFENGLNLQDAYIKVVHFDGNKNNMYFNIQYYASQEIADADFNNRHYIGDIEGFYITPDLEDPDNIIKQCYKHLKKLDKFKDATDV